jgi:cholesterol oxidase
MDADTYDFVIVGSGFGGSVSALRLAEKGYRVLVLERGRRLQADDFPKTNWSLSRWLWLPQVGFRGLFNMSFMPHVTALSGVGVGGGSLVYANTLPVPKSPFFKAPSWAHLADWERELAPHYQTALRMLGATKNPNLTYPDEVLREVGRDLGREAGFEPANVAVYFGDPSKSTPDPFFGGQGPERVGCNGCGGCMLGCRFGAKNTLDKNYLYLAERLGARIEADTEVVDVRPVNGDAAVHGYEVHAQYGTSFIAAENEPRKWRARQVVFAGGVMGTVELLLKLRESGSLPRLSPRLGEFVRTNSEVLMGVVTEKRDRDLSRGIAIGSILHTDENSHLEPVRYPAGAGFFRTLALPHAPGETVGRRLSHALGFFLRHPIKTLRAFFVPDWAKFTMILLYMRTGEGHLRMRLGRGVHNGFRRGVTTELTGGAAPKAWLPEATDLGRRVAEKIDGMPQSILTETLFGVPTTAHILGGSTMGETADQGVIDAQHRVHGHPGLYVIDGSAVSANPGVNPSLTITALAERAMTFIPNKAAG